MPRKSDIHSAFVAAIQLNPKGYQCLHTNDFIRELRARNWHFTPDDRPNRLWMLRNMGRVL